MQIYSTNARFYSKNTLFCPLKCVFYKQTDERRDELQGGLLFRRLPVMGSFRQEVSPCHSSYRLLDGSLVSENFFCGDAAHGCDLLQSLHVEVLFIAENDVAPRLLCHVFLLELHDVVECY